MKRKKQNPAEQPQLQRPIRLWPGVVTALLFLVVRFGLYIFAPEAIAIGAYSGVLAGLAIIVWWAFFSRAPRIERWGAVVLMIASLLLTFQFLHESIAKAGMGMMFPILALPFLSLAFVLWAAACRNLPRNLRRASMVAVILLTSGVWTLLRTGGVDAGLNHDFAWRWTKSAEEKLLAQTGDETMMLAPLPEEVETDAWWPGFRGPRRDGIARGPHIATDWTALPPAELWRRPVGPGWSSFSVQNGLFYTQEQRGEEEIVSCYSLTTGEPVWRHHDPARFWESNSGAGPRGTPSLKDGRVYSMGATGILNVLDAGNGAVLWSRNAAVDTGTEVPYWGISSSPLVSDNSVIVAVAGSLIAYDPATGEPLWIRSAVGGCYSSPHLFQINGVPQILLQNTAGVISVTPADGTLLWEHAWEGGPIVQPALIEGGDILISIDEKSGVRRISVSQGPEGWTVEERWTSARLKPFFNDTVIHKDHAYGFDGPLLACVDIKDGSLKWRGGRYGRGQVILLAGQDLLLVLSERGALALVQAVPDQFAELARYPAIEGKTWNHPVLVGDVLLVRNGQEMAAFRLPLVEN